VLGIVPTVRSNPLPGSWSHESVARCPVSLGYSDSKLNLSLSDEPRHSLREQDSCQHSEQLLALTTPRARRPPLLGTRGVFHSGTGSCICFNLEHAVWDGTGRDGTGRDGDGDGGAGVRGCGGAGVRGCGGAGVRGCGTKFSADPTSSWPDAPCRGTAGRSRI
jgi:hypothetical protein